MAGFLSERPGCKNCATCNPPRYVDVTLSSSRSFLNTFSIFLGCNYSRLQKMPFWRALGDTSDTQRMEQQSEKLPNGSTLEVGCSNSLTVDACFDSFFVVNPKGVRGY